MDDLYVSLLPILPLIQSTNFSLQNKTVIEEPLESPASSLLRSEHFVTETNCNWNCNVFSKLYIPGLRSLGNQSTSHRKTFFTISFCQSRPRPPDKCIKYPFSKLKMTVTWLGNRKWLTSDKKINEGQRLGSDEGVAFILVQHFALIEQPLEG